MRTITPTLAICATAFIGAGALLALPADTPSTPRTASTGDQPATDQPFTDLVIEEFAFGSPSVRTGATVPVVNRDGVEHTVTADDGTFDITVGPGSTTTFDAPSTPGTYTFVCLIHPSMSGSIAVT
jgi:plastocyanin